MYRGELFILKNENTRRHTYYSPLVIPNQVSFQTTHFLHQMLHIEFDYQEATIFCQPASTSPVVSHFQPWMIMAIMAMDDGDHRGSLSRGTLSKGGGGVT